MGLGKQLGVILDRTAFYAEMGGQEGDHGRLAVVGESGGGGEFKVEGTRSYAGYVVHFGHVARGELRTGDRVAVRVDRARRAQIQSNHTATHLADLALRNVLGTHVDQKGSLVAADRRASTFARQPRRRSDVGRRSRSCRRLTVTPTWRPSLSPETHGPRLRRAAPRSRPSSIGQPVGTCAHEPGVVEVSVEFCGGRTSQRARSGVRAGRRRGSAGEADHREQWRARRALHAADSHARIQAAAAIFGRPRRSPDDRAVISRCRRTSTRRTLLGEVGTGEGGPEAEVRRQTATRPWPWPRDRGLRATADDRSWWLDRRRRRPPPSRPSRPRPVP